MVELTVFTPTYNRASTLHRVRDSLLRQTVDRDRFEWVIIDDGSMDGTRELVESWMDGRIAIRYVWQENAGKHFAWNRAVSMARGPLFLCLDSDDACVPHTIERFVSLWAAVSPAKRKELAGILVRCQTPDGAPIGRAFPKLEAADFAQLYFLHGVQQETWTALRTDVLRANPFPEVRVRCLPEGFMWHKIGRQYRWLLHDECLRVYFTADSGRSDQLSRISGWGFAAGMALMHQSVLDHSWRFLRDAPFHFLRTSVHFARFSLHARFPIERQIASLQEPPARALCWAVLPAAVTLYALDRIRGVDR